MICPDCDSEGIPDNPKFGKVTCEQCKTTFRFNADGLQPDWIKGRMVPPNLKINMGPRIKTVSVIRCMACMGPVESDAEIALVQRAGGRWPIKGPVCKQCEGDATAVMNREGDVVQRVKILPVMGFFLPQSRSHAPIEDDGINHEIRPRRQTLTGLRFEPEPNAPNERSRRFQRLFVKIHSRE